MEWADRGIVLSARRFGESSVILDVLTQAHGRHAGLVRGGASRRMAPVLQPGNTLSLIWRARLQDHLGGFAAELETARAAILMERRASLTLLAAAAAVAASAVPEREPHGAVFDGLSALLDVAAGHGPEDWGALYVRWELGLLQELGYGLDLAACAATGLRDDLAFVSPRSGRAVSRAAGAPWAEKLFALPEFLLGRQAGAPAPDALAAALAMSRHFLLARVLEPHGRAVPDARLRLEDLFAEPRLRTEANPAS